MLRSIQITSGARLHITLLDMHGAFSNRVDGGLGVPLEYPRVKMTISRGRANGISVNTDRHVSLSEEIRNQLINILGSIQEAFQLEGVEILFSETIPEHAGFGSKTQTLLAAAYGYGSLYDLTINPGILAQMVKRGGTSGIGVESFFHGGLIVDCGHSFESKGNTFTPSSRSYNIHPPPLVGRYPFPDWPVLIVTPHGGKQIYGDAEKKLFEEVCPIPLEDVQQCAHVILMMTIPAVLESDLKTFCKSVNIFQKLRWKQFEIDAQAPVVRKTMDYLAAIGLEGIGMSSWGASVFAFGEVLSYAPEDTLHSVKAYLASIGGGYCFITRVKNDGALIEKF